MAIGPYQHVGFAYQGIDDTAYQIAVIGSGSLICLNALVDGSGEVTGAGSGSSTEQRYYDLDIDRMTFRRA